MIRNHQPKAFGWWAVARLTETQDRVNTIARPERFIRVSIDPMPWSYPRRFGFRRRVSLPAEWA